MSRTQQTGSPTRAMRAAVESGRVAATKPRGPVIVLDGVSKRYRRFAHSNRFLTLKSAFVGGNLFRVLSPDQTFTALEDISVEIRRGETFGVIGGNGAGKSTLMKIVAGTTKPTEGSVAVDGKISALIELGAGFHPEISGRENVYINAIMLGLTRREIEERFDEIVEFSGLREFIENPVKTYSSGMYMRLGFSVAIHVDPDILVIDEVLAVGDEAFVHKCLEKIGEFKRRGKTILLVTHGMETVRKICDRAMWLQGGETRAIGDPVRVIDRYLEWVGVQEEGEMEGADRRRRAALAGGSGPEAPMEGTAAEGPEDEPDEPDVAGESAESAEAEQAEESGGRTESSSDESESGGESFEPGRWGNGTVTIEEVLMRDSAGVARRVFTCGDPVTVELRVRAHEPVDDFVFGIGVFSADGVSCYGTNTDLERYRSGRLEGDATVRIRFPALHLLQGTYYLDVAVHRKDGVSYDYQRGLHTFRTTSAFGDVGVARLPHGWEFEGGVEWEESGGIVGKVSEDA